MKKGKHFKTRNEKRKENAKKQIRKRFILLSICLICVIFIIQVQNKNEQVSAAEGKTSDIKQSEEIEKEEIVEKIGEEIVPSEEEDIKNLIAQIKITNNLTEENFAFFYYNPQTKKYYFDNQDKYFKAASTIKVPVAMIYYDKIKNGELTLANTLQYTNDNYEEGGGTTASLYNFGDYIPISFLLEQSVVNSDNTAVNILIDGIGYREIREQIASYSDGIFTEEFYKTNLTSAEYAYNVINCLYQNQINYQELIEYMKKSSSGEYLKKYITEYDVAHKYGSYEGNVHDYGIVYTNSPYLIGVFTNGVPGAKELIENISREVLDIIEEK